MRVLGVKVGVKTDEQVLFTVGEVSRMASQPGSAIARVVAVACRDVRQAFALRH